ncbi:MAG: hypothetical protein ACRDMA_16130 [Solirubrobacterales bacterium]
MTTVIIIIVAVLIVLVAVFAYRRIAARREATRERLAADARGHRQEADAHASKAQELSGAQDAHAREAEEHERLAERHAAEAERHREEGGVDRERQQREGRHAARHDEQASEIEKQL